MQLAQRTIHYLILFPPSFDASIIFSNFGMYHTMPQIMMSWIHTLFFLLFSLHISFWGKSRDRSKKLGKKEREVERNALAPYHIILSNILFDKPTQPSDKLSHCVPEYEWFWKLFCWSTISVMGVDKDVSIYIHPANKTC